jgi:hypothetical protein
VQFATGGERHLKAGHAADVDGPAAIFFRSIGTGLPPERIAQQGVPTFGQNWQRHRRGFPLTEIGYEAGGCVHGISVLQSNSIGLQARETG